MCKTSVVSTYLIILAIAIIVANYFEKLNFITNDIIKILSSSFTIIIFNIFSKDINDTFIAKNLINKQFNKEINQITIPINTVEKEDIWTNGWRRYSIGIVSGSLGLVSIAWLVMGFSNIFKNPYLYHSFGSYNNIIFLFSGYAWINGIILIIIAFTIWIWINSLITFILTPTYLLSFWKKQYFWYNLISLNFIIIFSF